MRFTRNWVFAIAVVSSWALLAAWAAGLHWSEPLFAQNRLSFDGNRFRPVIGSGDAHDAHLRVSAVGPHATNLQSIAGLHLRASDFSLLRYQFADLPRTLEVSFVFRRTDQPDDVHAVSLPWPGKRKAGFDLRQVAMWRGTISEIGFAEYPTPLLAPPELGFRPFNLSSAALWSPSWRGDLDALVADWFGDWPWSQRSVHALGRDSDSMRGTSVVLFVALAGSCVVLWAIVLLGLRSRRLMLCAAIAAAAGWLALDLRWQSGLGWRLSAARDVYASQSWTQREHLVADSAVQSAAERVAGALRREPEQTRILVQSASTYSLLRLIWHLAPRNAAVYAQARASGVALPPGTVIVVYDDDNWRLAPHHAALLTSDGARLTGNLLLDDDGLLVWRTAEPGRHGTKRPLMGRAGFDVVPQ